MRTLFLLCCCLLVHHTSSSQDLQNHSLLVRPLVVLLDSGQVVHRTLIGVDTSMYRAIRLKVDRVDLLEYGRTLHQLQIGQLTADLRRSKKQLATANEDFAALATVNKRLSALPLAKPLLFDPHTYIGAGVGAVALIALKIFLLH